MYTEELWKEWHDRELRNYKEQDGKRKYLKKGYAHFDHRIWLPTQNKRLKKLLQNGLQEINPVTKKLAYHGFTPFLRQLLKTPRFRYQEEEGRYGLEFKIRPICFASHLDSLIYGFYAYGLNKRYQEYIHDRGIQNCVLAYRSDTGKSNIQYSKEVFDLIKNYLGSQSSCTVVALDIKGYFDHILHPILKEKWTKVWGDRLPEDQFRIFKTLTNYSYVKRSKIFQKYDIDERKLKKNGAFPATLFEFIPGASIKDKYDSLKTDRIIVDNWPSRHNPNPKGIPQGSSLSALLSNIYLIDYDEEMNHWAIERSCVYRRYCDDIILICPTNVANEFKQKSITDIREIYGLTIQDAKAEVIDFMPNSKNKIRGFRRLKNQSDIPILPTAANERSLYKNLQYLGFEFNGKDVFIRTSSLSRYFRKMKGREDKTVSMAYSSNSRGEKIHRYQIYERYSHLGEQNFLSYAKKAASKQYRGKDGRWHLGHDSKTIRQQLARHMHILDTTLEKKNLQRYALKRIKGKNPKLRSI
ncbi:MAG: reverse transcriptase domain-containing protein [Chitinophagaceae bacterium]